MNEYEQYLLLEKSYSKHTVAAYLNDLGDLADYLERTGIVFENATIEDLSGWIEDMGVRGISPRSTARKTSAARTFYKFLDLTKRLEKEDPARLLDLPQLGIYLPDVLTVDEIDAIIDAIPRDYPVTVPHGEVLYNRNRAIVETLFSCGIRVSELVNLKISQVYADDGYIRVTGKGEKERIVPISNVALELIGLWLQDRGRLFVERGDEDILFLNNWGRRMTRVMVFVFIKRAAERAGITKKISPHTFRHSFATQLMLGGADLRVVQELLGHASITTTELYTHVSDQLLMETVQQYHPRNIAWRAEHGG